MAHIAILIGNIGRAGNGDIDVSGLVWVSADTEGTSHAWSTTVAWSALDSTMDAAIKAAAIAVIEDETEYDVELLDKKTLFGAVSGL